MISFLSTAIVLCGCEGPGDEETFTRPSFSVFPDEDFMIAGPEGGPFFPSSKIYLLSNSGDGALAWTARSVHPAISFSTDSGILAGGDSEIVTVFANVVPDLDPGRYVADFSFTNETVAGEEVVHQAILSVSAIGALTVSPTIGFSSSGPVGGPFEPLSQLYVLSNEGSAPLDWSVEVSQPWLAASVSSGQLQPGGSHNVMLSIDSAEAAQLPAASHIANVSLHDLTNSADFELIVSLNITEPASLVVTPQEGLTTTGPPSGPFNPSTKTYTLLNAGSELLNWQVTKGATWSTLSQTSGSLAPGQQTTVVVGINMNVTSGLSDGTYTDTISFANATNGLGNTTRSVVLNLVSPPAQLTVTPDQGFSSSGPVGGPFQPASRAYTVTNNGGLPLLWQASSSTAWLVVAPSSGNLASGASTQVVVSIQQGTAGGMANGQYTSQISFVNLTNGNGTTSRNGSLSITSGGGSAPVLIPGTEFTGPTQEPGQIGPGTARCIARWDVVPYQTITSDTFEVGVVAFHREGIDRVEMSVEGGPWVTVTQMTLNPRVNVWEYWATLNRADFGSDEVIELRAIAYPKVGGNAQGGYPRLISPLFLYMDGGALRTPPQMYCSARTGSDSTGNGTQGNPFATPWKAAQAVAAAGGGSADGGTVWMDEGTYAWAGRPGGGSTPATSDQYLTFRPWSTARGEQVRIETGPLPDPEIRRVHFYDVTITQPLIGVRNGDVVWIDNSRLWGPGRDLPNSPYNWLIDWSDHYCTDIDVRDSSNGVPDNGWVRGARVQRTKGGAAWPRLLINATFDDVDSGNSAAHSDFILWHVGPDFVDNEIIYGVKGTNLSATCFFMANPKRFTNVALVNVLMQGNNICIAGGAEIEHLLLWHVTIDPFWEWQLPQSKPGDIPTLWPGIVRNLSIRGSVFSSMGRNPNWNGPDDAWFDNNHYAFGNMTPGTNVTTGDPLFGPDRVPLPNSPLRNRMNTLVVPVDLSGAARSVPGTLGAYQ